MPSTDGCRPRCAEADADPVRCAPVQSVVRSWDSDAVQASSSQPPNISTVTSPCYDLRCDSRGACCRVPFVVETPERRRHVG